MTVSRVFSSKNLKPLVVSLKPGFFGGVGGLTPESLVLQNVATFFNRKDFLLLKILIMTKMTW